LHTSEVRGEAEKKGTRRRSYVHPRTERKKKRKGSSSVVIKEKRKKEHHTPNKAGGKKRKIKKKGTSASGELKPEKGEKGGGKGGEKGNTSTLLYRFSTCGKRTRYPLIQSTLQKLVGRGGGREGNLSPNSLRIPKRGRKEIGYTRLSYTRPSKFGGGETISSCLFS